MSWFAIKIFEIKKVVMEINGLKGHSRKKVCEIIPLNNWSKLRFANTF
jgi:hypothetical protein